MTKQSKTHDSYQLWLPYYKQGDDLSHYLYASYEAEESGDTGSTEQQTKAIESHIGLLTSAIAMLTELKPYVADGRIKIEIADTHHIEVSAPVELGNSLVEAGLLTAINWMEDEEENSDTDFEDEDESDEEALPA